MKKTGRIILTALILSIACAAPVFATESNLTNEMQLMRNRRDTLANAVSDLAKLDDGQSEDVKAAMNYLVDLSASNIKSSSITERQNYIKYLQAIVGNAIETERIKKANVNALTDLVKVNPSFQPQLDAAIAEYNKAVEDHALAEAAIEEANKAFDEHKAASEGYTKMRSFDSER